MRRFYSPNADPETGTAVLSAEEADHLKVVLRMGPGDQIAVFDGEGFEYICEIGELAKRGAELKIISKVEPNRPESLLHLTLAASLLKSDRFELVIQKSVELGVSRLIPIITHRCESDAKRSEKKMVRWRKIIIEASKQCGRAKLMELCDADSFDKAAKSTQGPGIIFSEKNGEDLPDIDRPGSLTVFTGPEGGWEDSELKLAGDLGFYCVTLGGRILRAETAAIIATGLIQHRFGDLR